MSWDVGMITATWPGMQHEPSPLVCLPYEEVASVYRSPIPPLAFPYLKLIHPMGESTIREEIPRSSHQYRADLPGNVVLGETNWQ